MDLYTNCLFLLIANIILVFLINLQNKKHKGIVDLVFFDGASNVQNAGKFYRQGIHALQLGTVPNMLSLSSLLMSSPRFQHLRFLQTLLRSFVMFLDPQGMSSLPYSTIIPKSTTRASVLA